MPRSPRIVPMDVHEGTDNTMHNGALRSLDRFTLKFLDRNSELLFWKSWKDSHKRSLWYDLVLFVVLSAAALACFVVDVWVDETGCWPPAAIVPASVWLVSSVLLVSVCVLVERSDKLANFLWLSCAIAGAAVSLSVSVGTGLICVCGCADHELEQRASQQAMGAQVVLLCTLLLQGAIFRLPVCIWAPVAFVSGVTYVVVLSTRAQSLPTTEVRGEHSLHAQTHSCEKKTARALGHCSRGHNYACRARHCCSTTKVGAPRTDELSWCPCGVKSSEHIA